MHLFRIYGAVEHGWCLVDRKDPDIISKLTEHGKSDVVWTNYASQETYQQAVSILAEGGNLNSYAGAVDPDLLIEMPIAPAVTYSNLDEEVFQNILKCIITKPPMIRFVTADWLEMPKLLFGI